jgi:hypothetical protein
MYESKEAYIEWMKKAIEKADELNAKFQGPHELTDRHGWTACCCGNVDGCKWCAMEVLYAGNPGT